MKHKEIAVTDELKPQQSLEAILQLEIEIAEKIAEAKDHADQKIISTQNNITDHKNRIVEDARVERDRVFNEGVEIAQQSAKERVETAKQQAEEFVKAGTNYEKEATELVLKLIIGSEKREER